MKLSSLFESLLVEDFGKLKALDLKLLNAFKKADLFKSSIWLGRNSEVSELLELNNFNIDVVNVLSKFNTADPTFKVGIVFYDSSTEKIIGALCLVDRTTLASFKRTDSGEFSFTCPDTVTDFVVEVLGTTPSRITDEFKIRYIQVDNSRRETKLQRLKRQDGVIPVNMSPAEKRKFETAALGELADRLRSYKNSKKSISMKELLDEIKKQGYLKNLVVDGYEFKFSQTLINFDAELDETNWRHGTSEVAYAINEQDPKYKKVMKELWPLLAKVYDDYEDDKEMLEHEKRKIFKRLKVPPSQISFKLGFEGAALVPKSIVTVYAF